MNLNALWVVRFPSREGVGVCPFYRAKNTHPCHFTAQRAPSQEGN